MRIVIVGFPMSGKTTLFTAISGVKRDHVRASDELPAAVHVPEPRLEWLRDLYKPRKYTEATVTFVDLPGTAEGDSEHAGLTRHLPTLREADALLLIVRAFESDSVPAHRLRIDPRADLSELREEMLLADFEICSNRLDKLRKAVGKPSKTVEHDKHELALMERCQAALEANRPLSAVVRPGEEEKMVRSFGFLTQKPALTVINVGEAQVNQPPALQDEHAFSTFAVCAPVESDILQLDRAERPEFMASYGIVTLARDRLIRASLDALGMICFFTVGEDEVRAWPIPRGATAVEAAGKIHTDLARGFIRAEVVGYDDFRAAGSMREVKAAGKLRQEARGYVVHDGDIINVKFNV